MPHSAGSAQLTFGQFATQWLGTYVATKNKLSERKSKESVLRCHLIPFFGTGRLHGLDSSSIEAYKSDCKSRGLSNKTINNHLSVLHRCLVCAQRDGLISAVPFVEWLQVGEQDFDFLSSSEITGLLGAANDQYPWREMITSAVHTGMRLGELAGLEWAAVDLAGRQVTVRQSYVRGAFGSTKSNRIRRIPINRALLAVLTPMPGKRGLVFARPGGLPIPDKYAWKGLQRVCRRAGIRPIGWHVLRHTFASQLVARGVPLRTIQLLLGHSTIAMTERYSHLAPSYLASTVATLEDLTPDNLGKHGHPVGTDTQVGIASHLLATAGVHESSLS